MLNVKLEKHDKAAILHLDGRIDANNAPELERVFLDIAQRFDEVVLDFKKVPYISSAGLRALRILHRAMKEKEAEVAIRNVRQDVMGVFRVTGIAMFFNFE